MPRHRHHGQADLRSATRDWLISSTAVAPSVTIQEPVEMTPPFAVPAITVEPGGQMTFSGTASDDEGLKDVEFSLRNSSTGEGLANDCTWAVNQSGNCRISPVNIGGSTTTGPTPRRSTCPRAATPSRFGPTTTSG